MTLPLHFLRSNKHALAAGLALWLIPLASLAQTTPAEAPAEAPAETPAPTPVETPMNPPKGAASPAMVCIDEFQSLDRDGNRALSEAEAPAAHARARVDGMTLGENGLSQEDYNRLCENKDWYNNSPEDGAPFEGANSFTEAQARDRIMAWDYTDVSALAQDDKGIWRGTAKQGGADVDIAVDYKGNVVASPK